MSEERRTTEERQAQQEQKLTVAAKEVTERQEQILAKCCQLPQRHSAGAIIKP